MARKGNDRAEIERCIKLANEIVDETLPPRSPHSGDDALRHDRTELRKVAFGTVLRELLDYEITG